MEGLYGSTLVPTPLGRCRLRCNIEGLDCLTWYPRGSSGNARTQHEPLRTLFLSPLHRVRS